MKLFPAGPDLALLALIGLGAAITGAGLARGEAGPAVSGPTAVSHTIEIRQLRFEPERLVVQPGDTVLWINRDVVPHTVAPLDESWSSDEMVRGQTFRWIAHATTTLEYFCEYHPNMLGTVEAK